MDNDQRCLRLCAAVLLSAVLLRMGASGALRPAAEWVRSPAAASFLWYLQTGRVIRTSAPELPVPPMAATEPEPEALPAFSAEELERLSVNYRCEARPDLEALLTQPLSWELCAREPRVLIVHTHTSESYTPETPGEYEPSGEFRTLDPEYNVLKVGALLADRLREAGIGVLQDREFHDYPSYNDSYPNTRAATEQLLEQYPSVELILDLHRDAADTPAGQLVTQCPIGDETGAQLMMVVGTGECGLAHPGWERNLSLALKLQALLERQTPGICRKLTLTSQRYNQHLGGHALLIEVGAAGNTLAEAQLAAGQLAEAIIALKHGSL